MPRSLVRAAVLATVLAVACGGDDGVVQFAPCTGERCSAGTGATGGATSTGGGVGTGGASGSGGDAAGGATTTGGAGGAAATGGVGATGGALPDGSAGGTTGGTGGATGGTDASAGGTTSGADASAGGTTGGTDASAGGVPGDGGGSVPEAGTAPDAGPADSGQDAGSANGGDAAGVEAGSPGSVRCGDVACEASQVCCFQAARNYPPAPATYTCARSQCPSNTTRIACDGPEDCGSGKRCCRNVTTQGTTYLCQNSCTVDIGCGGPDQCASGELCCESTTGTGIGLRPTQTACTDTCSALTEYILCYQDSDCPPSLPSCVESNLLAGFRRCQ